MEQVLFEALRALHPIRDKLVIIGGSAHRLFYRHELGEQPNYALLTTEDVDIAAPLELARGTAQDLVTSLKNAGFDSVVKGADEPAYTYEYAKKPGAYVQFVTELSGSGVLRNGQVDREMKFHGLHAEKLRDIDILLHRPWNVTLHYEGELAEVRVVNPVAYILQKLLCLPRRLGIRKQGKDLLYLFDSIVIFRAQLPALAREAANMAPELTKKRKNRIRDCAHSMCFVESDAVRQAAEIAGSQRVQPPSSAQIAGACSIGLKQLLEPLIHGL